MSPGEVSHGAYQEERNAAEIAGTGTASGRAAGVQRAASSLRGVQGTQYPWAESRGGSLWAVSRGETFGPGAGRQRLLRCPEGETLWPRQD